MSIEKAMYDEAIRELEKVKTMELGSDQHVKTVGVVNSMVDRLGESQKLDHEAKRLDIEEARLKVEAQRLSDEKKDRMIKNAIVIGTNVLFLGVTIWANIDSKRFEQGYTHTTESGKNSSRTLVSLWNKIK